jgi:hypothetical protein
MTPDEFFSCLAHLEHGVRGPWRGALRGWMAPESSPGPFSKRRSVGHSRRPSAIQRYTTGSTWHILGPDLHPLHDHITGHAADRPISLQQQARAGVEFHPFLRGLHGVEFVRLTPD